MRMTRPSSNRWRIVNAPRLVCVVGLLLAAFVTATAQPRGQISGRVISEDGSGMAKVTVQLSIYGGNRIDSAQTTDTDADGNFQFINLRPRSFIVTAYGVRGYAPALPPLAERQLRRFRRLGDHVVITMIKGGAITGRVTGASGEPIIGVGVSALRVRDHEGHKLGFQGSYRSRQTDDRGVYRLYGLPPGSYLVVANSTPGGTGLPIVTSPYYGDTPVYHPSATRDTAVEVAVTSGGESAGIDIRYRSERGHAVSGKIAGGGDIGTTYYGASVQLAHAATGAQFGNTYVRQSEGDSGFAFHGVPDGEYELTAMHSSPNNNDPARAAPRRITVKGADVSGVELRLTTQATLAGRVIVAAATSNACAGKSALIEIVLLARRDEGASNDPPGTNRPFALSTAVNERGEFTLHGLAPGRYRLAPDLPNEHWFTKSITVAVGAPTRRATAASSIGVADITRAGVELKSGAKVSGVTLTIADNGASLRGRYLAEQEGAKLPARLRVYLLPAEMTAADDLLRYRETFAHSDGQFTFGNLAPGRYRLLARPAPNDEAPDRPAAPAAWDNSARAQLRQQAAAAKIEMELQPCQQLKEQTIKYASSTPRP